MDAATVGPVTGKLRRLIESHGPVPLSLFMGLANQHYYATRDPLGAGGDFTTAPEISQTFGEMIGLWCADLWLRAGKPDVALVELGPGRGTLARDGLRSMARFGLAPRTHFVETSPVLRDLQAAAVPGAVFHADASTLPDDAPLIVVANEFFDALPIRQLVRTAAGWRERMVDWQGGAFVPVAGLVGMDRAVPARFAGAQAGAILETSPASVAVMRDLAGTIARQGGAMLIVDYGHGATGLGDTLQAVERHGYADPFAAPGERDLTAHVDFGALVAAATAAGLRARGPVGQGAFLRALGIDARVEALAARHLERAEALAGEHARLCDADAMGRLFKAMAVHHSDWPAPEGFA